MDFCLSPHLVASHCKSLLLSSKINKLRFVKTRYFRVGRIKSVWSSNNNRSEELHRTRCLPELPDRSLDGATQAYYQRWTGTLCYSLINLIHYCKKSNLRFSEVYNLIVSIEYVTGWRHEYVTRRRNRMTY